MPNGKVNIPITNPKLQITNYLDTALYSRIMKAEGITKLKIWLKILKIYQNMINCYC